MVVWDVQGMFFFAIIVSLIFVSFHANFVHSLSIFRWWRLREAQASQLLTNNLRMQIVRRKYNKARAGTVRLQAQYRGRNIRKVNGATRIQSYYRMHVQSKAFRKLKSAIIALQCCVRRGKAKGVFEQLKREAKDMGKVNQHNEKLKAEMASLKAMLQAQASNSADKEKSEKAIKEKQAEIDRLEGRIAQLEAALAKEKENVKRLENDLASQKEGNKRLTADLQFQKEKVSSTQTSMHRKQSSGTSKAEPLAEAMVIGATMSSEDLAHHHAEVARLEEELDAERKMTHAMRTQIKNLRASMADKGVVDVTASSTDYMSDAVSEISGSEMDTSDIPDPSEVEQARYVHFLLRRCLNECSSVPFLFHGRGGFVQYPLQSSTLLHNGNGILNKILTICTCLLQCYLFRLVVLLVLGLFLIVIAMFVVLRWHHSVNYARMRLLALYGSFDEMSGATRMLFTGFATV